MPMRLKSSSARMGGRHVQCVLIACFADTLAVRFDDFEFDRLHSTFVASPKKRAKQTHPKAEQPDVLLGNCMDKDTMCPFWGLHGECSRKPQSMMRNCQWSCDKRCHQSSFVASVIDRAYSLTHEDISARETSEALSNFRTTDVRGATPPPTRSPTGTPTNSPTYSPSSAPSLSPTTASPSASPTPSPTATPTPAPTVMHDISSEFFCAQAIIALNTLKKRCMEGLAAGIILRTQTPNQKLLGDTTYCPGHSKDFNLYYQKLNQIHGGKCTAVLGYNIEECRIENPDGSCFKIASIVKLCSNQRLRGPDCLLRYYKALHAHVPTPSPIASTRPSAKLKRTSAPTPAASITPRPTVAPTQNSTLPPAAPPHQG